MTSKVLIVDDEESILRSFIRLLHSEQFEVFTAPSGEEALKIVQDQKPQVLISDMRMPKMNGVEFLERASEICPQAIPMLLSGYADIDAIMKAINQGHIWHYIAKPWKNEDVILAIRSAFDTYSSREERRRLTEELVIKNRELAKLNEDLEQKVKDRTSELESRNEILDMVLNDTPIDEVCIRSCEVLSQISGGDSVLWVQQYNEWISSCITETLPDIESIKLHVKRISAPICESGYCAFPLLKGERILGVLILASPEGAVEQDILKHRVSDHLSLLAMVLSHLDILSSSSQLVEDIDNLLEE